MSTRDPFTVTVNVEVGLDTVIGEARWYDPEAEEYDTRPVTIGDRVAELVAQKLVSKSTLHDYQLDLKEIAEQHAAKLVAERFAALFDTTVQRTDSWGQPVGQAVSLGEFLDKKLADWLKLPDRNDGYGKTTPSPLNKIIADAIGDKFKTELSGAVAKAKADALKVVQNQAAQVIADTVARIGNVR